MATPLLTTAAIICDALFVPPLPVDVRPTRKRRKDSPRRAVHTARRAATTGKRKVNRWAARRLERKAARYTRTLMTTEVSVQNEKPMRSRKPRRCFHTAPPESVPPSIANLRPSVQRKENSCKNPKPVLHAMIESDRKRGIRRPALPFREKMTPLVVLWARRAEPLFTPLLTAHPLRERRSLQDMPARRGGRFAHS